MIFKRVRGYSIHADLFVNLTCPAQIVKERASLIENIQVEERRTRTDAGNVPKELRDEDDNLLELL